MRLEDDDTPRLAAEPNFLYSNRAYWYLQAPTTDYATATLRLTVPATHGVVASGELAEGSPVTVGLGPEATNVFFFTAKQPVRYLAAVVSRFVKMAASPRGAAAGILRGRPGDTAEGGPGFHRAVD